MGIGTLAEAGELRTTLDERVQARDAAFGAEACEEARSSHTRQTIGMSAVAQSPNGSHSVSLGWGRPQGGCHGHQVEA